MKHQAAAEPSSRSWILVLALLIGFPVVAALAGRLWLGVPTESHEAADVFSRLTLSEVPLVEKDSLHFGELFFCKFRVVGDSLSEFKAELASFDSSPGLAKKPISLKLERDWWQPPADELGTYWKKDLVTLWSPKDQPDLFYAVVHIGAAGDEVKATKTSQ